jgi:hypothetical protein
MKPILTFCLALMASTMLMAQTYNVTFSVDMNEVAGPFTTPEVNGSWDGWCGGCTPLSDPDGDGIWSATKELAPGFYEYKFAYDSWTGSESLVEGSDCTITTAGFTNRFVDVVDADVDQGIVCYGACTDCAAAETYEVTFQVNMNDVTDPFTTPEVNGAWDGWCGGCTPLSDPDGDGIWTGTKTLAPGSWQYKFAFDSWTGSESLIPGADCTVTIDGFTNRISDITSDTVLPVVCYGSCVDCEAVEEYSITFQVNMNDVAEPFTTPEVNGTFNGWCGGCNPLEDPEGDGIWTTTITLEAGFYEFKYAADSWTIQESLTEGDPCTITTDGFTNRFVDLTEDMVMDVVCWGACEDCAPPVECAAPDDASVTASVPFGMRVEWTAVPGISQYGVQYREAGTGAWSIKKTSGTSVKVTGLIAGTTYDYRVASRCPEGGVLFSAIQQHTLPTREGSFDGMDLSLYPNPSNGVVYISGLDFGGENIMVRVMDMTGKVVYEGAGTNDAANMAIDLSNLTNGLYMLTLENGVDVQTFNISIVK